MNGYWGGFASIEKNVGSAGRGSSSSISLSTLSKHQLSSLLIARNQTDKITMRINLQYEATPYGSI